jgi:hypothetical protein
VWSRFNRPREQQQWYYEALAAAFKQRLTNPPGNTLAAEFENEVRKVFGLRS